MLTDLAEAVDQKPFSLRPCGISSNKQMAKQVFRYKQEKEEGAGNIRQLQKHPFLEKKTMHLIMKEFGNT